MSSRSSITSSPRFLKALAHSVDAHPFGLLTSVFILAIAIFATALSLFALQFSHTTFDTLERPTALTIHLMPSVDQAGAESFIREIQKRSLGKSELISPDSALKHLVEELSLDGDALGVLSQNPLSWTVEVAASTSNASIADLEAFSQEMRRHPAVADVTFDREFFERFGALVALAQNFLLITFVLSLIFALTASAQCLRQIPSVAPTSLSDDPSSESPNDDLLSLTHIVSGILLGITAALIAFAGFWAIDEWALPVLNSDLHFIFHVRGLPTVFTTRSLLGTLCLGLSLGIFGSAVSMRHR